MTPTQIHPGQWISENKVIRPLSINNKNIGGFNIVLGKNERELFETFAKQNTYATDLPDGTYNAEQLEIAAQWKFVDKHHWYTLSILKIPYEEWDAQMPKSLYVTRKAIGLKPHPMKEPLNELNSETDPYLMAAEYMKEETTPTAGLHLSKEEILSHYAEIKPVLNKPGVNEIVLMAMEEYKSTTPAPLSEQKQEGETVFSLVFKHPDSKEVRISKGYTPLELLNTDLETIQENTCDCNCQPIGESNYKDCNCLDYYELFQHVGWQSQNTAKQIQELQISVAVLELGNESKQVIINDRNEQIDQYKARIVALEALLKNSRNAIAELNETEFQFGIQLCNDIDAALKAEY